MGEWLKKVSDEAQSFVEEIANQVAESDEGIVLGEALVRVRRLNAALYAQLLTALQNVNCELTKQCYTGGVRHGQTLQTPPAPLPCRGRVGPVKSH